MMVYEAFGLILTLLILTWLGLGLALALVPEGERRLELALGIAPTIGLGLIVLLAFPLYRYVAPLQVVTLPLTVTLGLASSILIFWDWKRNSLLYRKHGWRRNKIAFAAVFFVLAVIWTSPLVLLGIQYAIYRSNSSDAFFYIAFGEIVRVVPWDVLNRGAALTSDNLANVRQLAMVSPAALFSARALLGPHPLGKMLFEAWAAQLLHAPVFRFYFASNLVPGILAFTVAYIIAGAMDLSRWFKYLGAATIAFGFWVRVSLEHDAGYEVTFAPFLWLFILAWVWVQDEPLQLWSRARILMAFTLAVLLAIYVPPLSIIAVGGLIYYATSTLQHTISFKTILYQVATVALALGVLGLTGQIDFLARSWYYFASIIGSEQEFEAPALYLLRAEQTNLWRAFWGMTENVVAGWTVDPFRFLIRRLADIIGIALSVILASALGLSWTSQLSRAERLVLAMATATVGLIVYFWWRGFFSAAAREVTYGFGFLVLALLLAAKYAARAKQVWIARGVPILLGTWMTLEIGLGLGLPFMPISLLPRSPQPQKYDLQVITAYLDEHKPHLVLVSVPKTNDWEFAYYVMLTVQPYPTYFQSGIVADNSTTAPAWWFDPLTQLPDYALITREDDYIAKNNWGTPVAETRDLILYHLTTNDLAALNAQEQVFRARDGK